MLSSTTPVAVPTVKQMQPHSLIMHLPLENVLNLGTKLFPLRLGSLPKISIKL